MTRHRQTRRQFITSAAALGALSAGAAARAQDTASGQESTDRLRCGFIGIGTRGGELLDAALTQKKVDVVAVADTYDRNRDEAAARCRKKYKNVAAYTRFEDLLAKEKLHTVVVATPDHIHAPAILAALNAGLDVYTEKPMTLTWQEAKVVRDQVRASRAVLQVGTQLRSTDIYQKARDVMQSGDIGKLVCVRVNRSYASKGLKVFTPPKDASEKTVHWDLFLRHTKKYPYDPVRYFRWRQFVEYSNGYIGDLMLHHMDICHFITGCGMPRRVMSTGGKFFMDDQRTTPDTVSTLIEYPENFVFNYTTTVANARYGLVERYIGTAGVIEIREMKEMTIVVGDKEQTVKSSGLNTDGHMGNFFDCVRSRKTPIASIDAGLQGAVCCHMAVLSQQTGESAKWDPAAERVII